MSDSIAAYRRAWDASDTPPSLAGIVAQAGIPVGSPDFVALVSLDLTYRWSRGFVKRLEEYIHEFPTLSPLPTDLILAEYRARQRYATTAPIEEYCQRFPDRAETIIALLSGTQPAPQTYAPRTFSGPIEAGQSLDDFDLLAKVGEGSFAKVFLARQRSLQRLVALKISSDHGAEPMTLAQLDHPHIVRVYDQRTLPDRGLRLLYMPYLPGGTLADVLKRVRQTPVEKRNGSLLLKVVDESLAQRGEVPPTDSVNRQRIAGMSWGETVCGLGARLADALEYAHQHGVLHRDLKPANILLGSDAAPRLADFNVSSSTAAGDLASFGGSIAYMSPEQLEAFDPEHDRKPSDLDGRSDVYSLAVTLWELLTGERPYSNEPMEGDWSKTLGAMVNARNRAVPNDSRQKLPHHLPPGLVDVLTTALTGDASHRFATAHEFARQLDLCLKPASRALLQPKPGWRTWVARHPIVSLIVVALVPNIIAALFNIEYNRTAIVEPYPDVRSTFQILQVVVNGTFFPACIALYAWYLLPVTRGLHSITTGELSGDNLLSLRRQCLALGPISVWVCLWAWVLAGVIFPVAMHLRVHELPFTVHLHFVISQTLSGLLAVAYPQFGITFLVMRCLYPKFVRNATLTVDDVPPLRTADRMQGRFLLMAASVPMFAVALLAGINTENRLALMILSLVALVGFAFAFWLTNEIRNDRLALEAIVTGEMETR